MLLVSIIKEVEGNDPNEIAKCMVNGVVNSAFKHLPHCCQKVLNPKRRSTAGNKILIFQTTNKTWKERSVIMYFFLHDCLGESLCNVEIHNLLDEPSVVRLVVLLRLGPFE